MSTMKKRIPMFLLALAMMVAMALPTFAASPPYSARVWIYNCENSMPNLNAACFYNIVNRSHPKAMPYQIINYLR